MWRESSVDLGLYWGTGYGLTDRMHMVLTIIMDIDYEMD